MNVPTARMNELNKYKNGVWYSNIKTNSAGEDPITEEGISRPVSIAINAQPRTNIYVVDFSEFSYVTSELVSFLIGFLLFLYE